jgi:hypothetical protein
MEPVSRRIIHLTVLRAFIQLDKRRLMVNIGGNSEFRLRVFRSLGEKNSPRSAKFATS